MSTYRKKSNSFSGKFLGLQVLLPPDDVGSHADAAGNHQEGAGHEE